MVKETIWYLDVDNEHQLLYYSDKPSFHYSCKKDGKTVYLKNPIWSPIRVEFPTRPLSKFYNWIKDPCPKGICLTYNVLDKVVEKYLIEDVVPSNLASSISLIMNDYVFSVVLSYKYSRREI